MAATREPCTPVTTEAVVGGMPMTLRMSKVRVEVVQGPDRGASVELGETRLVVGRSPGCNLVLSDPTVSGMHTELSLEPTGVLVRNLASRNGVHAGGAR